MDAASGGEAPPELVMAWSCERWHALPDAGGMLDQDWRLIERMGATKNVNDFLHHLHSLKGKQIHTLTAGQARMWKYLIDEGYLNGE